MTSIRVIKGPHVGKQFEIARGIATIGREQTNSVHITDIEVSRHHAELHFRGGEFWIFDLKSPNGTYVNDQRIDSLKLQSGDRIRLGETTFVFDAMRDESNVGLFSVFDYIPQADVFGSNPLTTSDTVFPISEQVAEWVARAKSNIHVMYQTALATSHYNDIEPVVERMLDLVFTWIAADRACVLLANETDTCFESIAFRQVSGDRVNRESFHISQELIDYVVEHKEGTLSHNVRIEQSMGQANNLPETPVVEVICVPIRGRSGIRGLIYVDRLPADISKQETYRAGFDEDQLKLMIAIGHQAAVAIENADYYAMRLDSERSMTMGKVMESLSHHIKNILQSINGGTHLIEDGLRKHNYELVQNGWQIVQRNQETMSNLVMDMLTFSKQGAPLFRGCDLNELVRNTVRILHRRAVYFDVEITINSCAELVEIPLDSEMIRQAIYNVLSTAIFSCRDNTGGRITIKIQKDGGRAVQILIEDNGISLTKEELDTVFDPLVINEYSNRTGIRMAVSKKILLEHGGDIRVMRNAAEKSGTVFILTLPTVQVDATNNGQPTDATTKTVPEG